VALDQQRAFHALFAPVDRRWAGDLAAAGGLGDAAIHGDVVKQQADDAVVGVQSDPLELGKNPEADPLVAAGPDGGGRAGAVGDALVGAAEPQHLQQLVEHDPVRDPPAVAAPWVGGDVDLTGGQQRGELVPQRLGQP
jgi:hypothetical protein